MLNNYAGEMDRTLIAGSLCFILAFPILGTGSMSSARKTIEHMDSSDVSSSAMNNSIPVGNKYRKAIADVNIDAKSLKSNFFIENESEHMPERPGSKSKNSRKLTQQHTVQDSLKEATHPWKTKALFQFNDELRHSRTPCETDDVERVLKFIPGDTADTGHLTGTYLETDFRQSGSYGISNEHPTVATELHTPPALKQSSTGYPSAQLDSFGGSPAASVGNAAHESRKSRLSEGKQGYASEKLDALISKNFDSLESKSQRKK